MSDLFKIKILEQHWLENLKPEEDLCSHGIISLIICREEIVPSGDDGGYTINTSALAMLRTLKSNHTEKHTVAEKLIECCQNAGLYGGCPRGVNWYVKHISKQTVRIYNVVFYPTVNVEDAIYFQDLDVEIPFELYRSEICKFASEALQFFEGIDKQFYDHYEEKDYERFWEEYNRLLKKFCC